MTAYADRLDTQRYADDPVVAVHGGDPAAEDTVWLPERLFARLTLVARAYELPVLPLLGGPDPVALGRALCESVVEEVEFVADRLDDPLLHRTARLLVDAAVARLRRPAWPGDLVVEGE